MNESSWPTGPDAKSCTDQKESQKVLTHVSLYKGKDGVDRISSSEETEL